MNKGNHCNYWDLDDSFIILDDFVSAWIAGLFFLKIFLFFLADNKKKNYLCSVFDSNC